MSRLLSPLCAWLAMAGAAIALVTGLMTTASVVLRSAWSWPIPGDVEITQMGIALAISLCLPYCQLQKANIIVDFFTQRAGIRTQRTLDAAGCLLLVVFYSLLAWRSGVGAVAVKEAGETTMVISLPMWWAYASLSPGLALAAVVALLQGIGMLSQPEEGAAS